MAQRCLTPIRHNGAYDVLQLLNRGNRSMDELKHLAIVLTHPNPRSCDPSFVDHSCHLESDDFRRNDSVLYNNIGS
jgi:hypothetical protein